jgi:hypothetical protein
MHVMPINSSDKSIYEFALARLEQERDKLTGSIVEIQRQLGNVPTLTSAAPSAIPAKRRRKKRVMSPEGRARLIAALKRRWAKAKAAKAPAKKKA